ncbi:MAG TPA: DUF2076 family protein [Caulobacteraceae bacterium]|jgi:hypothetical protein|nr:DUF2076 family protein [Caulobacteraceae bacterium]
MIPDERTLLQGFLSDLARTSAVQKDPEAAAMISQAVQANPDAVYLLVQHALLSDQALHSAQQQMQALQSQIQSVPPAPAPSFLAGPTPWGGQLVQSSPIGQTSGLGGFLRTAGTMAAGVAGGDLIAQGIENLFAPRW